MVLIIPKSDQSFDGVDDVFTFPILSTYYPGQVFTGKAFMDLEKNKMYKLKELAKAAGITYSGLVKADLVFKLSRNIVFKWKLNFNNNFYLE